MVEREFLGWHGPMAVQVADWLLARREELPGICVIVPTSHSGRRLRQVLAERAGALLSPAMVTPASLLQAVDREAAPPWQELLAWCETLESVEDWEEFGDLFPQAPDFPKGALQPLAGELRRLAMRLQENGQTFGSAGKILAKGEDGGRWHCLAGLEDRFRKILARWGVKDRSGLIARLSPETLPHERYVLAGVPDMPPLVARLLRNSGKPVHALIGAPVEMADHFNDLGLPEPVWCDEEMPWPEEGRGSVRLAADMRSQAREALLAVSRAGLSSDRVALGAGDGELAAELARVFTANGWPAFDPAPVVVASSWSRWLRVWQSWLREESTAVLADLLALPESAFLMPDGRRAEATECLGSLRDRWMARTLADLKRLPATMRPEEQSQRDALLAAADAASQLRLAFLQQPFPEAMELVLTRIPEGDPDGEALRAWVAEIAPTLRRCPRPATFWLDLWNVCQGSRPATPPEGRVIDVLGWLELPYECGSHLIVCGMNEGKVPSTVEGDPWLGESTCRVLGLPDNTMRAARDAFLARHLFETRRTAGRVDWIVGKSGPGGTSLLPSRILLAAHGGELARRVRVLFREIPPSGSGLRWHGDWRWKVPAIVHPAKISVTAFKDWIACPFRYYLKHVVRMSKAEPDRIEWNHRDFGNVFHDVMESWANDPEARDFSKTEALEAWFSRCLDDIVARRFGKSPSLAIRLQAEALRARLGWLAEEQAILRAEGWRPVAAEEKFELKIGSWTVVGKIDRIDEHPEHGLRVIDYKTSANLEKVVSEHCKKITNSTKCPEHWGMESPIVFEGIEKDKAANFRWTNLQLPLYAAAIRVTRGTVPMPAYMGVGASRKKVKFDPWEPFPASQADAALRCAEWILERISAGTFWPPAEKSAYQDDMVNALACGRDAREMFGPV